MRNRTHLFVVASMALMIACSSGTDSGPSGTGGARSGGSATGGSATGGSATGGSATGGSATGGRATGGSATGGYGSSGGCACTGGAASGGSPMSGGLNETGGNQGSGGANTGGTTTGGAKTGGAAQGGSASGGQPGSGGSQDAGAGDVASTGGAPSTGGAGAQHWVGTWAASPYVDGNSNNKPPISLSNSVIRQVTHVSLGGSKLRFQFSNLHGNGSLTIKSAHIALCKATPLVDSTIDTATDKALLFSGSESVTIGNGKEVWSDPIDFTVPNQGNITITTALGNVPSTLTQHSGSRTTSYFQSNSTNVTAANMNSAQKKELWFFISGIDVMADESAVCAVAIGDSITDGRGVDVSKNNRWTDVLAARLQGNPATKNVGMLNQGIGATNLVGMSGTAAQARFNRDVLGQSSVRYVIVYDGVNDIGGGASASSMKTAYQDLITRAHAKGLLIYGATITPFYGYTSYYSTAHEATRQEVNTFIRSGAFDAVIDFEKAVSDGGNPPKLKAEYAAWSQQDWLHPGPAGYQKMGETPDLELFTK